MWFVNAILWCCIFYCCCECCKRKSGKRKVVKEEHLRRGAVGEIIFPFHHLKIHITSVTSLVFVHVIGCLWNIKWPARACELGRRHVRLCAALKQTYIYKVMKCQEQLGRAPPQQNERRLVSIAAVTCHQRVDAKAFSCT